MDDYDLRRRIETIFNDFLGDVDLQGLTLLDAGCGTGFFSAEAFKRGAKVFSLDIGARLLAETRRKAPTLLVAGDITSLPFGSDTFDIIVSSECIEHTTSPRHAVDELARALRTGGIIVITCPNRFWYWSCWLANALNIRPYKGLENWPSWSELRKWLRKSDVEIQQHLGLHLFPFVLKPTRPLLRLLDKFGLLFGPLYVNQCIIGVKKHG